MACLSRRGPTALILGVVLLTCFLANTGGYRIHNPEESDFPDTAAYFPPYSDGFTGRAGAPTNPGRIRVNEGLFPFTRTQPNIFEGTHPRQQCPGMVGPIHGENDYYCTHEEAGYCDRRSGACFCSDGYAGPACDHCHHTHYAEGQFCREKILCPDDCSGQGVCDYSVGACDCNPNRVGENCGDFFCAVTYDERCVACDTEACTRCVTGFYITADNRCNPCTLYDPRCTSCNDTQCQTCGDPLLFSTRRSGRRLRDTQLPLEEFERQLSYAIPFGSKSQYAFEEAEPFDTLDPSSSLKVKAQACEQGLSFDDTWVCKPQTISNIVCGHVGTLAFTSPTYSVQEDAGYIRLTVTRSGGGFRHTSVEYSFEHKTSSDSDVTATAFYTTVQRLLFEENVVSATFLITVNDDLFLENDEEFILNLRDATNGASLGPQRACVVRIHDNDKFTIHPNFTSATGPALTAPIVAGDVASFAITARTSTGEQLDGARFVAQHRDWYTTSLGDLGSDGDIGVYDYNTEALPRIGVIPAQVTGLGNGTYGVTFVPLRTGNLSVWVQLCTPRGLLGEYFDNAWFLGDPSISRVDQVVNFTWGGGRMTQSATDYVSARWTGKVLSPGTGEFTFHVLADDNVRLWIDYNLIIDRWDQFCNDSFGTVNLVNDELYDIRLEFRDREEDARLHLSWSSAELNITRDIIPPERLFVMRHIKGSPFEVEVVPAAANTYSTLASGQGIVSSVAGSTAEFLIHSRDEFGNDRKLFGATDNFQATATLITTAPDYQDSEGQGLREVPGTIVFDTERGLHRVSYIADVAGEYELTVGLRTGRLEFADIVGSPFRVEVPPAPTSAPVCDLWGQGVIHGVAGVPHRFQITARDFKHNLRRQGGDTIEVRAYHDTMPASYVGSVEDLYNGTYKGLYIPLVAGNYTVAITLNGLDVAESPYTVFVNYAETAGRRCIASGPGLLGSTSDQQSTFQVFMRDAFDNPRDLGGDNINTTLTGPDTVQGTFTDFANGTYEVQYVPTKAGVYTITVRVGGEEISGSPFHALAMDGITAGFTSSADGIGLTHAMAGVTAPFVVQARDVNANNRTLGGDTLRVELNATRPAISADGLPYQAEVTVEGTAAYIGDGKYQCQYVAAAATMHTLRVFINDMEIDGSPFHPVVIPNRMNATNSVVSGSGVQGSVAGVLAPIFIKSVDAWNNDVLKGGDLGELTARMDGPDPQVLQLTDLGNGDYSLPYIAPVAGDYTLVFDLMEPGFLNGVLFSKADLLDPLVFRQDSTIDFDWGEGTPHPTFANSEFFSAQWTGFLRTHHDELHTFTAEAQGDVRLWVGDSLVINAWPSNNPFQQGELRISAGVFYDFRLDFASTTGSASIRLLWSSPSMPQQVVPGSAYFLEDSVADSPYHPVVVPAPTSPPNCLAFGDGLFAATANIPTWFQAHLRDEFNNSRGIGGNVVEAFAVRTGPDQPTGDAAVVKIPMNVEDLGTGDYNITYTPTMSGIYSVSVTVNAIIVHEDLGVTAQGDSLEPGHVINSPFVLKVADGETVALMSVATGSGLYNAEAGIENGFQMQAKDIRGNHRTVATDTVVASLDHADGETVVTSPGMHDAGGLYKFRYNPSVAGSYAVHVRINGADVQDSPFALVVRPTDAFGPLCLTEGTAEATTNATSSFTITSKDRFNNTRWDGGDRFVVRLTGPGIVSAEPTIHRAVVADDGAGMYTASFFAPRSGTYSIDVRFVDANETGLLGEYFSNRWIEDVPAAVQVDPVVDFDWPRDSQLVTDGWGTIYNSVRWTGYVQAPVAEYFTFHVAADDGARLWIADELLVDALEGPPGERSGQLSFQFVAGQMYEVRLEYRQLTSEAVVRLQWESPSTPLAVVPQASLFPRGIPILDNPFHMESA